MRRGAAEPLVRGHRRPLRAPGQAKPDHGAPGRVRHQEHGEGKNCNTYTFAQVKILFLKLQHFCTKSDEGEIL